MHVSQACGLQATPVMSAEADGSADGADEAEQEQRFARCRPLAPADSARWRASEQHRLGRIFYGNDNFFIFFRLHQHLYDRQVIPCSLRMSCLIQYCRYSAVIMLIGTT